MKKMENENKIKYSYEVERYTVRDTFYKDRSFLMDKFSDYRQEMNKETTDMKNLKERELKVFTPSGNKIEMLEKKNGKNWEVEKFIENINGEKFEFEKGKENNDIMTYTDAIYLSYFEKEKDNEFSKIVNDKFFEFKDKMMKEVYETGFKLAEFDTKNSENVLDGVKDYERTYVWLQDFDYVETETLENSISAAQIINDKRLEIVDNETGTSIRLEKGVDGDLIFKADLKEAKDLQDFVDFYNVLKSKESFKSFENAKIKLSSPDGKATILNNGEEIKYSGKIKAVDKVVDKIAKELGNAGFKKTKINGSSYDADNKKEQKNKNSFKR